MRALVLAAVVALTLGGAAAHAEDYTYVGSHSAGDQIVSYTLVTDSNNGPLTGADFVSFNVNMRSLSIGDTSYDNTDGSVVGIFTATPDYLVGRIDDSTVGQRISGPDYVDAEVDGSNYINFFGDEFSAVQATGSGYDSNTSYLEANIIIAVASSSVSAAPEPSTWLLMFAGIGGIGLMLRQAKRKMGFRFKDALAA